jgi:hypothetical protein
MKEKLKTLKEIEITFDCGFGILDEGDKYPLRQELIKWYKYFDGGEKELFQNWNKEHAIPIKEWIKHFGNLTEEELK